jgi:hypothetical protein
MRPKPDKNGILHYKLSRIPDQKPVEVLRHREFTHTAMNRSRPTEKQIQFALSLLASRGYGSDQTTQEFEDFGLPFQPNINTECWLASLSIPKIKMLIDDLQQRPMEFNFKAPGVYDQVARWNEILKRADKHKQ